MEGYADHEEGRPSQLWGSRNRQSDSQHGFGSPEGMELTGPTEPRLREHQANPPGIPVDIPVPHTALGNLQALADLDSPSTIFAASPDSEFPTPRIVTPTGRQSPPDMMEQLVGRQPPSPRRHTPDVMTMRGVSPEAAAAVQTPEVFRRGTVQHDPSALSIRHTQPSRLFANPPVSSMSPSSRISSGSPSLQPHMFLSTPSSRSLRNSHMASRLSQPGYSAGLYGSAFQPEQMGTPGSNVGSVFRRSDAGDGIMIQGSYDSASDSDISVKERLTDQVRSLDELLLSTKKQLGGLSQGSSVNESSLSSHNDNLGLEELNLEDMRRALQQELLEVDYSVLEEAPDYLPEEDGQMQDIPPPPQHDEFSSVKSQGSLREHRAGVTPTKSGAVPNDANQASHQQDTLGDRSLIQDDRNVLIYAVPASLSIGTLSHSSQRNSSENGSGSAFSRAREGDSKEDDTNVMIYAVPASLSIGTISHSSQRISSENGSGSASSKARESDSKHGSIPSQVRNNASSSVTSQATIDLESISGDDNSSHPEIFEAESSLLDPPYVSETPTAEFDSLLGKLPREDDEDIASNHEANEATVPSGASPRGSERSADSLPNQGVHLRVPSSKFDSVLGSLPSTDVDAHEDSLVIPTALSSKQVASFDHGEEESIKSEKYEIDAELQRISSDGHVMDREQEQRDRQEFAELEWKNRIEREALDKIDQPNKSVKGTMRVHGFQKSGTYDQSHIDSSLVDEELGGVPATLDSKLRLQVEGSTSDLKENIPLLLVSNIEPENGSARGSDIPKFLIQTCLWLLFLALFLAAAGFVIYLTNDERYAMLPVVTSNEPSQSPSFVATFEPSLVASNLMTSSPPSEMPSLPVVSSQSPSITNETSMPSEIPSFLNETLEPSSMPSFVAETAQPTLSPTKFVIVLHTDYEILVVNGTSKNISQAEYEDDLVQSMDNLCLLVEDNIQRRLQDAEQDRIATILPTSILEFRGTNCTNPNPRDRCEIVVAEILLENAREDWESFLNTLNLAMSIGQLQEELDRINPNSPVEIIHSTGSSTILPSSTPSEAPTSMPSQTWAPSNTLTSAPTTPHSLRPIETRPPTKSPTISPTFAPIPVTSSPTPISTLGPSTTPTFQDELLEFLVSHSYDGGEALLNSLTPQHEAFTWLAMNNKLSDYSDQRLLQRYALATLYYSTDGDNWFFSDDWLSDEDECDWYSKSARATCSKDGAYVNLELNFNNMNGVLPPELGLLSNSLRRLSLQGGPYRYTGGTIPTELGYLSLLERFFIRNNEYSGTIPTQIGAWSNLKELDVSSNSLTGDVPSVLGLFEKLTSVDLSVNVLQGRIPSEIGNLANCEKLIVEDNILTGPVPTEIGRMTQLHSLRGGSNLLTRLPTEIGGLSPLETLSLYQNDLVGTVPSELSQLMELNDLDLSNNGLTGLLPSQLGLLVDIRDQINLSSNRLSGSLSTELGNLEHLRVLRLESNELTGPIPSEISGLSSLTTIRLDGNAFSGEIPNEVCGTFNETLPAFSSDCMEFDDNCPCCVTCCTGTEESCRCRYEGTFLEYLCFQQKSAG